MPRDLLCQLRTRGLNDRSKTVRVWAAHQCDTLRLTEMVPEMTRRAAREPDSWVKAKLEFHAAMLRDGYHVERGEGGRLRLCGRTRDGWSYQEVSPEDVDGGRIPALAAERLSKSC
jgi:hypothetical protein